MTREWPYIVNRGGWCQATVPTGTVGIRTAMAILKRLGYDAHTSNLGLQVTDLGLIKCTMLDIRRGSHEDTSGVSDIIRAHCHC